MVRKIKRNHTIREISLVTLGACVLLASNVFYVTIGKMHFRSGTNLSPYIDNANVITETTKALRGNIYDSNNNIIAQDSRTYNIFCILDKSRPAIDGQVAYVQDKETTAEVLSKCLRMDYETVMEYLNLDVYQTELGVYGRQISKSVKDEIESYNLPGIEFTDSVQRVYPIGQFSSNLIGYAQSDESGTTVGQMGLELYLDSYLQGQDGSRTYQVDKDGYVLPGMKETIVSATNGNNVYLTLNSDIQTSLEEAFKQTTELFDVKRVWGGAMEINTGKVIAWGQYPTFNPNTLENIPDYNDFGSQLPYEPGSTLKTFVWAAAMNEGKYNGDTLTDGNQYCFYSDGNNNPIRTYSEDNYGCITNAYGNRYGQVSYDYGLAMSLNTVAVAIQNEAITPATHLEYMKKFGFFQTVDTDGINDNPGTLNFTWPGEKATLSYGHGSTVTMLQMLQAYSAICGDGRMIKPYFVESIRDYYDSNKIIYQAETQVASQPITEETAKQMQSLLSDVVNKDGMTGMYYRIPECKVLGKTGTTVVASDGGYESSSTSIYSAMLALPAEKPQVILYYAFEAKEDRMAHYHTEPVTSVLRKIALTYGFTNDESDGENEVANEPVSDIKTNDMPNLINHTVDYANKKLEGTDANIIVLGDGESVIDQFPKENGTFMTGQRIFLITDKSEFTMPDLKGWTRKDVAGLWAVTGIGFQLKGEGKVVSQSIPPNTKVSQGSEIVVEFE